MKMSVYIVDYENVTVQGLQGTARLTENDKLCIFYGPVPASLPFANYLELANTKAQVSHIGTKKVAKNYLDFQVATYLGMTAGKGEEGPFRLITNDSGFDSIVDFLEKEGYEISRHKTIADAIDNIHVSQRTLSEKTEENTLEKNVDLSEEYAKKIALVLKTSELSQNQKKRIAQVFAEAEDRTELHQKIAEYFKKSNQKKDITKIAGNIYRRVKELHETYRGQEHTASKLERYDSISFEEFKEKAHIGLNELNIPINRYNTLYRIVKKARNKTEFKNMLTVQFGKEEGEKYYLLLFDDFMHYLAGQTKEQEKM